MKKTIKVTIFILSLISVIMSCKKEMTVEGKLTDGTWKLTYSHLEVRKFINETNKETGKKISDELSDYEEYYEDGKWMYWDGKKSHDETSFATMTITFFNDGYYNLKNVITDKIINDSTVIKGTIIEEKVGYWQIKHNTKDILVIMKKNESIDCLEKIILNQNSLLDLFSTNQFYLDGLIECYDTIREKKGEYNIERVIKTEKTYRHFFEK